MNLPKPKKSILHLRNKLATKKSFFVSDFDKSCMESIIQHYNIVEEEFQQDQKLFYKLMYMMIRYEIINNRLQGNKDKFTIKDIFNHIENLLTNDLDDEQVKMLLECQAQKTLNFFNSAEELTKRNINKLDFSDQNWNKSLELINEFIHLQIINQK